MDIPKSDADGLKIGHLSYADDLVTKDESTIENWRPVLDWLANNQSALAILIRQAGHQAQSQDSEEKALAMMRMTAQELRFASLALLDGAEKIRGVQGQGFVARKLYEAGKRAEQAAATLLG